ncbi:MAG: hypothetical protein K8F60_01640 [Melioribacteraceae bacterium]|jgi:hypothetical protein|nr:hypothetical protein [Ignavibacteriota bacterium]MBZ0181136.1 hypothetical protein [Melioribacteraceae bacterium]
MNILKLYKDTDNKDVREMFLLMCLAILGLMTMITLTYIFEEGSSSYYRAQNGLFILDIMCFLLLIGYTAKTKEAFIRLKKFFIKDESIDLLDCNHILLLVVYLIAITSFIFILDLSFMSNYGIKIGAVVAVTIVKMLKDIATSK